MNVDEDAGNMDVDEEESSMKKKLRRRRAPNLGKHFMARKSESATFL
jgi:hypothetical protein